MEHVFDNNCMSRVRHTFSTFGSQSLYCVQEIEKVESHGLVKYLLLNVFEKNKRHHVQNQKYINIHNKRTCFAFYKDISSSQLAKPLLYPLPSNQLQKMICCCMFGISKDIDIQVDITMGGSTSRHEHRLNMDPKLFQVCIHLKRTTATTFQKGKQ